jgi:hypothetical protein
MSYIYYGFAEKPQIKNGEIDTTKAIVSAQYKSDIHHIKKVKWIATKGFEKKHWSIEENK